MWTQYHNVSSISEVFQLLDEYQDRARIIAGGTDILLELEQGKRPGVDILIDITRIPDLDQHSIAWRNDNTWRTGQP